MFITKKITVEAGEKGLEAGARQERYRAFKELISPADNQSSVLLLGHHADDQAETLLLRLMRGSGLWKWRCQITHFGRFGHCFTATISCAIKE